MYQLLESVCIENKVLRNIELHNKRFNQSGKELFGWDYHYDLNEIISVPENISNLRHKCRVVTNGKGFEVDFKPYEQRQIKTLKIVHSNTIEYKHKTNHRQMLDKAFQLRNNADDVIIVKNGNITDSWAANILFFDGNTWFTPDTPLLKGVQREFLLITERISEKHITINDVWKFESIKLINAMISFEQSDLINVSNSLII